MEIYEIKKYCLSPENLIPGNSVKLLSDNEVFFKAVFDIIAGARKNIFLEFYEIADDALGLKISEALLDKAAKGVEIRLIYDSVGSVLTGSDFFRRLKKNGIQVREYNPVRIYRPYWKWVKRDHRKIIASDENICVVGGFNLSSDYAPYSMGGKNWKDFGCLLEGPALKKIYELFEENWNRLGVNKVKKCYVLPPPMGTAPVSVVSGSGIRNFLSIRRSYKYAIDGAKDFIYITNAYFLPDRLIYRKLIRAAMRGVKVKIITPFKTDHPYVRQASWAMFPRMIKNGIEIYEWKKEILHSKTSVIDGRWVSVGSHNLDHRSLHYNLELNLNVFDEETGSEMTGMFIKDLENCRRVTLEDCLKRPFSLKIFSRLLYFFRSWF